MRAHKEVLAAVFFFLPAAGAFAVGCDLRYPFRKAPCPWLLTLILLVPAVYCGWVYRAQSANGSQEPFLMLLWSAALAVGALAAEASDRFP